MREINKIAEGLFEKIRDRFEDVSLGNDNAKATTDPQKARFFNFDYVVDDTNHGNITMSLIDEISLKVYFSKNISSDLDDEQKKEWYSFLRELREFARRNLLSFEPRDITRSTLKHRDIQQQSKADSTYDADEVVAESRMYGTLNRSYESFGPVRIKLQHTKPIMDETHGARSRNIAAVFVENDQGERFRLPFENLTGARAMARHVSAGGVPTDELGRHITEMVGEMTTLRPFVRGMARRTFEDAVTKEMVESAFGYHALLKNTLKKLKGKRGYTEFKESFKPALVEDDANVAELKELFVKKTLDERIEQALPLVHKAYNIMKENNNPYAQQFENWADKLSEGSWALPDTDDDVEQLIDWMSEEHPVGVDAQDATNSLYNIIGDDRLFDRLGELAEIDPTADARDVVTSWLYDNLPQVYQRIESEMGDPDYPAEPAEDGEQEVDESKETRQALSDQDFEFPQQGQYGYRQGYKGSGVLELADGRTGKIINLGEFGDFDDEYKPNQKWLRIVFTNPNMDDNAWAELEDMLWSDQELTESPAVKYLSDATAKAIIDDGDLIYNILSGRTKVQPGEAELLQSMYDDISIDKGYAPDDDFEEIEQTMYDYISHDYSHVAEGNEYGVAIPGGTENMLATTNEDEEDQLANIEDIQSAIIRRILNSINDHSELLKKAGPEGIMNAASDVASFHAPMEEIGSSDVSIMVREVYREVGVDYPEDELAEAKDKVTYDPKTGKLTGWEHEGDWKKQTKKKDPVGKIHNLSDKARRETEKMSEDETLEETFERLVNEGAINIGDMIRDKTKPIIQGKVILDIDEKYIIQSDDEEYHILKLNAEKVAKEAIEMPNNPDYSGYDKPTFQRKGIVPGQPNKTLPGMNDKKKPGWVGVDTTKPAYQRQADYEQEREQMKKLAGVK